MQQKHLQDARTIPCVLHSN